jgi:hypothetical protein
MVCSAPDTLKTSEKGYSQATPFPDSVDRCLLNNSGYMILPRFIYPRNAFRYLNVHLQLLVERHDKLCIGLANVSATR